MDKMTVGAVSAWRVIFQTAPNVGMKFTQKDYGELLALCDLAKLALSPPQDVAGLVGRLRMYAELGTDVVSRLHSEAEREAADALLSLSARNRGLEAELAEAKSDELRNLNGDYDHVKEEYYSKGFVEAREAAARICDRNDKSAWGFAAAIRALIPQEPGEKGK